MIDRQIVVRFLENCGRFLRKYEESTEPFCYLVELLSKKVKNSPGTDGIYRQIESCIHYCMLDKKKVDLDRPPLSPLQEYVQHLLFGLSESSFEAAMEDFLRLPWSAKTREVQDVILDTVPIMRQEQVALASRVVARLGEYYPRVQVYIKDVTFEIVETSDADSERGD